MPTAEATLLPPACSPNDPACERTSTRHIEDVGAEAVLGAMVAARKRSSAPAAIELEETAAEFDGDVDRPRAPSVSQIFVKAR